MNGTKLCGAAYHLGQAHDYAVAAYWDRDAQALHVREVIGQLTKAATELGYRLEPIRENEAPKAVCPKPPEICDPKGDCEQEPSEAAQGLIPIPDGYAEA